MTPDEPLYAIRRIYMPAPEVLNGTWKKQLMQAAATKLFTEQVPCFEASQPRSATRRMQESRIIPTLRGHAAYGC
jgi:hypothetical protein